MTAPTSTGPVTAPVPVPAPRSPADGLEAAVRRRRRWYGVSLPGAWGVLVLVCLSLTPSLLPRSGPGQGVVTGISAVLGYGLGVLAAAVWRAFADRAARPPRRWAWLLYGAAGIPAVVVFFLLGRHWQGRLRDLMGMSPESLGRALLAPLVAVVVFALLLAVARVLRWVARGLGRLLGRWMGRGAARAVGGLLVAALAVLLVSGVALDGFFAAVDDSFAVANARTAEGVQRPASELRSGGPGSLIGWDSLGREGRTFVAGGPSAAQIADFSGAPAKEPIRVYAGVESAGDVRARARLAVDDLERAGGFERARLLVATTTGQGWLDAGSMAAFDYIAGGDSAIVAMQYSYVPSGFSYLVDQSRARAAGRELFDAVYERWAALPPGGRPQLYVFGESLGSFGAEAAFSGEYDLRNRVSGALFVGPPNFNSLTTEFRNGRDSGTRAVEPVYRDGRTVRFSTEIARGAPPADAPWTGSRVLFLQHPSDPIVWWSPSLLFSRPDWLAEPRGRGVSPTMRWLPLVTFWQVTLDMPFAVDVPEGYGHRYTREAVDAWATVLQPEDWSPGKAERLRGLIQE